MVETVDIDAVETLKNLNLESKLSDENGKVIDSFSGTYDISKLSPGYIEKTSEKENNTGIYLALFLLLIFVLIIFIRKKNPKPIFVLVLLLIGMSLIYLIEDSKKETEIIQAEEGVGNFSQTIGPYRMKKPGLGRQNPSTYQTEINASLNINYEIFLEQGDRILEDGDVVDTDQPIEFVFNKDGEWFGIGSIFDTPSPYWIDTELYPINDPRTMDIFYSLPEKGCEGINRKIMVCADYRNNFDLWFPLIIKNPAYQLETSGNVNCIGNNCHITGNGGIESTAVINETHFQQMMAIKDYPSAGDCAYYTNLEINRMFLNSVYYDMLPIRSATKTWHFTTPTPAPAPTPTPPTPPVPTPPTPTPPTPTPPVPIQNSPVAQIQCSINNCSVFENKFFVLLNNSYDAQTPDHKLKSVWVITGIDNPFHQRTECENKCNYFPHLSVGNYNAYLRVEDEDGLSDETTKDFKIKKDMKIGFECSLDNINWENCSLISALVNQEVFFKDISKPSEGANIIVRDWTFVDGNPNENKRNNEPNPSTKFISKGIKEILLRIKDSAERIKTASENIEIFLTEENVIKAMPNWREVSPKW